MSKPLTQEEQDMLLYLLKGDMAAYKLVLDIVYVGHFWDDLIDKDVERTPEDINDAFVKAFRSIPQNIFYLRMPEPFRSQLNGLIMSAAMQYRDSTMLEMGDEYDRFMAFVIRNAILPIIHYLIGFIGGDEWLKENGPLFWRTFGLKTQYEEYLMEK